MRILGIDHGEKRIGVAVSDPTEQIATGVGVIGSAGDTRKDIDEIKKVMSKFGDVGEIVVGLPKTMKGEIGQRAQIVLNFIDALKAEVSIPVLSWDERLSTVAVERVLIEADMSRAKRKKVIDKSAAVYLLQGYLDAKGSRNR